MEWYTAKYFSCIVFLTYHGFWDATLTQLKIRMEIFLHYVFACLLEIKK